jgi:hypothetical protein
MLAPQLRFGSPPFPHAGDRVGAEVHGLWADAARLVSEPSSPQRRHAMRDEQLGVLASDRQGAQGSTTTEVAAPRTQGQCQ